MKESFLKILMFVFDIPTRGEIFLTKKRMDFLLIFWNGWESLLYQFHQGQK